MTATLTRSTPSRRLLVLCRQRPLAVVSAALLVGLVALGFFAPWVAPKDPAEQVLIDRLQGPSWRHLLGTDFYGRDTFSRLIYATWTSLRAGGEAVLIATAFGVPLGLCGGYFGGKIDAIVSRIIDVVMALPGLILAIAIVGALGTGLNKAMIAIGVTLTPGIFRVVRGTTQREASQTYVEAARAAGLTNRAVIWRHMLPAALSVLAVQLTFSLGTAVVAETSLSFLGLGAQAPTASWGTMIRDGFQSIHDGFLPVLIPAVAIMLIVLCLSVVGDTLGDLVNDRPTETGPVG